MGKRPKLFVFANCGEVTIQTAKLDTTISVDLAESLIKSLQRAVDLAKRHAKEDGDGDATEAP